MSTTHEVAPAVSREVVLGASCFVTGAVLAALLADLASTRVTTDAWSVAGWVVSSATGVVLLDRRPRHALGWLLTLSGLVPVALAVVGPAPLADTARLGGLLTAGFGIGVCWAWHGAIPATPARVALAALAAAGGAAVAAGATGPGWPAVVLGVLGWWACLVGLARRDDRDRRRSTAWLAITLAITAIVVGLGWWWRPEAAAGAVFVAVVAVSTVAARLALTSGLRPLADHVLDAGLVTAALAAGAAVGVGVWWGARAAGLPSPGASALFSGLTALAAASPAAWWLRRTMLARRYGPGTLSPDDVAVITADLHSRTDPRELLERAARMVAAASGSTEARIELDVEPGEEAATTPVGWTSYPLLVGGDLMGTLLVCTPGHEGPEPREQRVVAQLLPTVALVARAVGLAVEAEHARLDVARQRDAERSRILEDLHDGLGPVLAGMSMRVQAARRSHHDGTELLDDLAADLARSRSDLRALVSGLTPSALDEGDLAGALDRLVRSFRAGDGPQLSLRVDLPHPLDREHEVVVYRCVAEGVTNALRHARPTRIDVCVQGASGGVVVEVSDDGAGGPVVPGVGLSSLRARAERLGGGLDVTSNGTGTRLRLATGARR